MRRLLGAAGVALVLLVSGAGVAGAQTDDDDYGGGTTSTTAPAPNTGTATVSTTVAEPGDPITVGTGADQPDTFAAGSTASAGMVKGQTGSAPAIFATATVGSDGSVSITFQIPEGMTSGVYYVYVVGTGPDGGERVLIVPIVIDADQITEQDDDDPEAAAVSNAATGGGTPAAEPAGDGDSDAAAAQVPTQVAAVQSANALTVEEETEVVTAAKEGAEVSLEGTKLVVNTDSLTAGADGGGEGSSAAPLTALAAVAVAGGGLVLLRRRPTVFTTKG